MDLFLISILIVSEVSLILAHLGIFSIWPVIVLIPSFLFYFTIKRRNTVNISRPLLVILFLAVVLILFFRPYQYMDGGWDPGNYINTGVHIARTGTVVYHDPFLNETTDLGISYNTGIKYPGLYIKDAGKGLVVPQFFHLYPVWIAIFYKLFGLKAVFYVNPFFALLSLILVFLIGEKLIGKRYGILSSLFLLFNVIQIWNTRFPTSEILGQFLFLTGFYFWVRYLEKNDKSSAFWAGIGFGEFLLVSVTSFLAVPVIFLYLFLRSKKKDIYFIVPFLFMLVHLGAQLYFYSSIYFKSVIMFFQKREIYFLLICAAWIITFLLLLKISYRNTKLKEVIIKGITGSGVLLLVIYAYFIRPHMSASVEAGNLLELGHWLSLICLVAALIGLLFILCTGKNESLLFFVIIAVVYAVFFLYDKRMNSRYPFALRRYIPVAIPAFCVCISYFFYFLNNRLKKTGVFLTLIIIPFMLLVPVNRCKSIIKAKDHYGWLAFWSGFADKMDNNALYISNNYRWARPLSDIFGENVVTFTDSIGFSGEKICRFAEGQIGKGQQIYYISDLEKPYSMNLDFTEVYDKTYKGEYIEDAMAFPPRVRQMEINLKIFEIGKVTVLGERSYTVEIGDENIGLLNGFDRARMFGGMTTPARWTFKKAQMIIPWFGDRIDQLLTVKAAGMEKKAGISLIYIYINDQPVVGNYTIGEEMKEYSFKIPAGAIYTNNKGRAVLTIKSNVWSPRVYGIDGFPDEIGILLDWVRVDKK